MLLASFGLFGLRIKDGHDHDHDHDHDHHDHGC